MLTHIVGYTCKLLDKLEARTRTGCWELDGLISAKHYALQFQLLRTTSLDRTVYFFRLYTLLRDWSQTDYVDSKLAMLIQKAQSQMLMTLGARPLDPDPVGCTRCGGFSHGGGAAHCPFRGKKIGASKAKQLGIRLDHQLQTSDKTQEEIVKEILASL